MPPAERNLFIVLESTRRIRVSERTNVTVQQLIATLRRRESLDQQEDYQLVRQNDPCPLPPDLLIGSFPENATLYLVDSTQPLPAPSLPDPPPAGERPQEVHPPPRPDSCLIEVLKGQVLVLPNEGVRITRDYLLERIPVELVQKMERLKAVSKRAVPIERVSREVHCEIIQRHHHWAVLAYYPTAANGRWLQREREHLLGRSTILTLGRHGWEIRVRIEPRVALKH